MRRDRFNDALLKQRNLSRKTKIVNNLNIFTTALSFSIQRWSKHYHDFQARLRSANFCRPRRLIGRHLGRHCRMPTSFSRVTWCTVVLTKGPVYTTINFSRSTNKTPVPILSILEPCKLVVSARITERFGFDFLYHYHYLSLVFKKPDWLIG